MAEAVQYIMESMIPELEHYQKDKIFTSEEIKNIIKITKDFEFKLKRRIPKLEDFLRYIVYEINLDNERLNRSNKKHKKKPKAVDYACMKRIHFTFQRALKKFKGNIHLWLTYIDYCKKSCSFKILGKLFAQAIQCHPLNEGFWISAAAWEYEHNKNIMAARTLMQRGLRFLPECENLWLAYFKLELLYSENYSLTLLDTSSSNPTHSKNDNVANVSTLSSGALPLTVFNAAMEHFATFEFAVKCAEIYQNRRSNIFPSLLSKIYEWIDCHCHNEPKARIFLAKRHLNNIDNNKDHVDHEYFNQLKKVLQDLGTALKEIPSPDMVKGIVEFLNDLSQLLPTKDNDEKNEMKNLLGECMMQMFQLASDESLLSPDLYLTWSNSLKQMNDDSTELQFKVLESAVEKYPENPQLWERLLHLYLQRLRVVSQSLLGKNVDCSRQLMDVKNVVSKAVRFLAADQKDNLFRLFFENCSLFFERNNPESKKNLESTFITFFNMASPSGKNDILSLYLDHVSSEYEGDQLKNFIEKLIASSLQEASIFITMAEKCSKTDIRNGLAFAKHLFERALAISPEKKDYWLACIKFELDQGNYGLANELYNKGIKCVLDPIPFESSYRNMLNVA